MQPEAVIPGSVPAALLLVRSESAGVAVGSLRSYPNGFEFTLHVRLRREDEEYRHGMSDPFDWHASGRGGTTRDQALRLGILYADERRAATTSRRPMLPDGAEAGELVLQGVTETRAQVDGSAIRAAASRAIELWPDDPDYEPTGGWASSTITAGEPSEPGTNSPPSGPC